MFELQLNRLIVSTYRRMWVTTTRAPHTNRPKSHSATFSQSIDTHVDAAYDIPAKGAVYIFTGTVMGRLQSIT